MVIKKLRESESFRVFIRSVVSKVGLAFLFIMVAVSVYVILTMPLDFGVRYWNNPSYWADYPKTVPPEWVNFISPVKLMPHTVLSVSKPSATEVGVKHYVIRYRHYYDQLPQTIVVKLINITYYSPSPPIIDLYVKRPDGREVYVLTVQVDSPTYLEKAPYRRTLRLDLTGRTEVATSLSKFLREYFNIGISSVDILQRKAEIKILMGEPASPEDLDFNILKGGYAFDIAIRYFDERDYIEEVEVVLMGRCYGFMGTDYLGRDLAQVLLYGFPVALLIGVVTSLVTTVIGTAAGIVSGYYGGLVDEVIQRVSDVLNNIPLLPLLIFFTFVVRMSEELRRTISPLTVIVIILIVFGWAGLAIIIRSMVLSIKSQPFVEAALAVGASGFRIMFRHILPQVAPYVFAQMMFFTPSAILSEAALSLLGLSDPAIPTWGQVLQSAYVNHAMYLGQWWWVVPPGVLIMYAAITFVFLAQGLEPVVEPRLRS